MQIPIEVPHPGAPGIVQEPLEENDMRLGRRLGLAGWVLVSMLVWGCSRADRTTEVDLDDGGTVAGDESSAIIAMNATGVPSGLVPSGSPMDVRLDQEVSSESAHDGDRWQGMVVNPVVVDGQDVIPSGATVEGVVVAAKAAERGGRASLKLGVRAVSIGDIRTPLHANSEPVQPTRAVAASKGHPVVLRDGTVMTFVTYQDVAIGTGY